MFISAINKVNDLMYIVGDMNVVELVTLLWEELVCSHQGWTGKLFFFTGRGEAGRGIPQ